MSIALSKFRLVFYCVVVGICVYVKLAIMARTVRITSTNVHCTEHVMRLGQNCALMG